MVEFGASTASCRPCAKLISEPTLQKIARRASDETIHLSHYTDGYLTRTQLSARYQHRRQLEKSMGMKQLTVSSQLRRLNKVASATDRILAALATKSRVGARGGRVANAPATGSGGTTAGGTRSEVLISEENVQIRDHAAVYALIERRPTLVVVELASLTSPDGINASTSGLTVEQLADCRTLAVVRPLTSTPGAAGKLLFSGGYSAKAVKVSDMALLPITLDAGHDAEGGPVLEGDIVALSDVLSSMWLSLADKPAAVEALSTFPKAAAHRGSSNEVLFVTGYEKVRAAPAGAARKCPLCSVEVNTAGAALLHFSFHAVVTPSTLPQEESCPLCYGPAVNCPPLLVKYSESPQPRIACSSFAPSASALAPDNGVKFQYAAMKKSTETNPSTNRPITCPACYPNLAEPGHMMPPAPTSYKRKSKIRPAVWSYNMAAHWGGSLHKSTDMPEGLARDIALAENEGKWLRTNRGIQNH
jgi:hypothetical protein